MQASSTAAAKPMLIRTYSAVSAALLLFGALLYAITSEAPVRLSSRAVIAPLQALVGLTAIVWLLMVLFRNGAVLRGLVSMRYYRDYVSGPPAEWVERPARVFDNLMQVPMLFYVVCVLMLVGDRVDNVQLTLAWLFVATRAAHAIIYIAVNHVPSRFASYAGGCITLGVLWARFAAHA